MSISRWPLFVPALALSLTMTLVAGCRDDTPVLTTRFTAFDTQIDVSIVGVNRADAEEASRLLEQDFAFVDKAWHAWDPGPLGRVNQLLPTGKEFVAPPSILPLVRISRGLYAQSGGLFNPATGYLNDLWGFRGDDRKVKKPPSAQDIRQLVDANPAMTDVHLDGS